VTTPRTRGTDTHVRMSQEDREATHRIAKRECRTDNGQILKWIREGIERDLQSMEPFDQAREITTATQRHVRTQ
jgi:predicted DNA-binding protein